MTPPTSSGCGEGTGLQAQWDNATGFQGILTINGHLNMLSTPEIGMLQSGDLQRRANFWIFANQTAHLHASVPILIFKHLFIKVT